MKKIKRYYVWYGWRDYAIVYAYTVKEARQLAPEGKIKAVTRRQDKRFKKSPDTEAPLLLTGQKY